MQLADRGLDASPRVTIDTANTLVAAVRGGAGVGKFCISSRRQSPERLSQLESAG